MLSEKAKLQISSNRINTLAEPIAMYIDKSFEGEETVLLINNLENLTVMSAMYHRAGQQSYGNVVTTSQLMLSQRCGKV